MSKLSIEHSTDKAQLKVADEVWIATALLHREHPEKSEFSMDEIVQRAQKEALTSTLRPGVYVHVVQHCVANRAPNPGRYRMLFETSEGKRRLFRKGDSYHPDREGGKITPSSEDLPLEYSGLLEWYNEWSSNGGRQSPKKEDPLLALRGSGQQLWASEHADDYVRRLREGWE
ncbi:MAG TPA: hypothetical protein VFB79_08745 [Candidatus Angelobacter sp.]|nr:hypothetical protein [Candidatus Angelobacter sp.]